MAVACIGTALLAAAQLRRSGVEVTIDRGQVAAAVRSERFFVGAAASGGLGFAPLSRFWPAADGWVRTHGNYPWHRDALSSALGVVAEADAVGAAIAPMPAADVEERVFAAGGIAAAVRSIDAWREHPQGRALAGEPLIHHEVIGDAVARSPTVDALPASGVRVLDLTRVIAGPVCTRFLAALGADVLRIDPPHRPDMDQGDVGDTLLGKRSAIVDLRSSDGAALAHELLDAADVIVCGYRPGALDAFGFDQSARSPSGIRDSSSCTSTRGATPVPGRGGGDSTASCRHRLASRSASRPSTVVRRARCRVSCSITALAIWPRPQRSTDCDASVRWVGRMFGACPSPAPPGGWPALVAKDRTPRGQRQSMQPATGPSK